MIIIFNQSLKEAVFSYRYQSQKEEPTFLCEVADAFRWLLVLIETTVEGSEGMLVQDIFSDSGRDQSRTRSTRIAHLCLSVKWFCKPKLSDVCADFIKDSLKY